MAAAPLQLTAFSITAALETVTQTVLLSHKENGENTPVEYVPTEAQAIEMLTSEMTVMNEYLVELDYQTAILSLGL